MRVTCIATTLSVDGGMGRMSSEIISRLRSAGIECDVVVQRAGGDAPTAVELRPLSIINFFGNVALVRRTAQRSDIVHAFDGWPYAVYALFAVLGTDKRLFVNGIGTYSLLRGNVIKRFLLKSAYSRATNILCVSKYVEGLIKKDMPGARTTIVYLGHTPLPQVSDSTVAQVREKYALKGCVPLVLTVGDIKHRKGQFDTLKAVLSLRKKYPHITYAAVGASYTEDYIDAMRDYARAHGAPDVLKLLLDVRDREDLAALFTLCDVYALNSNSGTEYVEGFGLSILEANGLGKLAIGSRGTGTEEAIEDGISGYLAGQRDTSAISEAIDRALTAPPPAAQSARDWAARFSWDKTAAHYVSLYRRATKSVR